MDAVSSDLAVAQRRESRGVARELPSIRNLWMISRSTFGTYWHRTTAAGHVLAHTNLRPTWLYEASGAHHEPQLVRAMQHGHVDEGNTKRRAVALQRF